VATLRTVPVDRRAVERDGGLVDLDPAERTEPSDAAAEEVLRRVTDVGAAR